MSAALDTPILDGGIRAVNFFNGRLLTARDLSRVQLAADEAAERLGQVVGDGIACGLEVDAPNPRAASPVVRVQKGLALNRAGETLCLDATTEVTLVPSRDAGPTTGATFAPCAPLSGGTYIAGAGIYLLTICSARATEGRAVTSGLDDMAGKCNTDTIVHAVQFRLIQLNALIAREDLYDDARARSDHEVRNRVAYKCYGGAALAAFDTAPLAVDASHYGLIDALRRTGTLSDCDVPLAILYWTRTGGIRFVDLWSVRRRVSAPSPTGARTTMLGDRRLAETEAMILQFEAQAEALRIEQGMSAPGLTVESCFAFLPPAAYLRVGARAFTWTRFLGAHAPHANTPLSGGLARAVLLHACGEGAVPVVPRSSPGAAQAVKYRVYRVDGRDDYVLLARSSLAETVARDVYLDNTVCGFAGANNVQDAIDELCRRVRCCCSVVLDPGADWERTLAALPPGSDAEICFQTGTFTAAHPVEIAGLRHVKVTGGGFGTQVVAAGAEAALVFRNCASVIVRDLHAEAGLVGSRTDATRDLGGALSFIDCGSVRVEDVSTKCASGPVRAAACIVVRNGRPGNPSAAPTNASIVRSRCAVGHAQVGILVVNVARSRIENNDVALADGASLAAFVNDPRHRVRLRRQLLSIYTDKPSRGKLPPTPEREHARANSTVWYGAVGVAFSVPVRTTAELAAESEGVGNVWTRIVASINPRNITDTGRFAIFLKHLAGEAAVHGGTIAALRDPALTAAIRRSFAALMQASAPAAHQGIVVAGALADDVRIRDNAIVGVEQGVHVGVSVGRRRRHKAPNARQLRPLSAGRVQVSGNSIHLIVSALTSDERHAIFVGNCISLSIENNSATTTRTAPEGLSLLEPMRLWGSYGRLVVTGNYFEGFTRAIYIRPVAPPTSDGAPAPWVVQHNSVIHARIPVETFPANLPLAVHDLNFP